MTRGVDERDRALVAVDLGTHLVGTDVLGDAAGLLVDHVGRAERVQELGLSVVDVTHDGDDRRTYDEVGVLSLVLAELEVERLEQLAVLVLGRDDLDDVVELLTEQLERLVVHRLGRRDHLAEREQHLHQRRGVDVDLLREVGQGRATGETDGLAVALADAHATDRRGLHGLELLATCPLRLATTTRRPARAPEGTLGLATLTGTAAATGTTTAERRTTATGSTATTGATATGSAGTCAGTTATGSTAASRSATATGSAATTRTTCRAAGATGPAVGAEGARVAGDHRRVGARHAGTAATRRTRRTAVVLFRLARRRGRTTAHALTGRERVVARTRRTRTGRRTGSRGFLRGRLVGGRLGLGRRLRLGDGCLGLGGCRGLRAGPRGGGCLGLGDGRAVGLGGRGCGGRSLLRSRLLSRRLDGLGGGLGGQQRVAVGLLELHLDGKLDRRGSRLDELAHLLQLVENFLALDAIGLGELVYSGLGHCSPSGPRPPSLSARGGSQTVGGCCKLIGKYSSSAHELLLQS